MNRYVKSDLYRYCGKTDIVNFIIWFFGYKAFRYMVWHRLYNYGNPVSKFFANIFLFLGKRRYLVVPKTVKIGYGFYIGHNGPILINETAEIGNNVNIQQFTTIGSNSKNAAKIGDNVWIGPNVCIVENIKIGNNVTIGAGSVVTKDIPSDVTAAGNYAKIISKKTHPEYIQNPWTNI